MVQVLMVDDDRRLTVSLTRGLTADGMTVRVAEDGLTGRDLALDGTHDLIVLDVMMPGRNGYQVCADLRAAGVRTPILMLTAKDGEYDEAEGLDTGADDYLTKPFSYTVLLARIRALLRRAGTPDPAGSVEVGDIRIDRSARRVWRAGQEVGLTAREFDVLAYFAANPGRVRSKWQILDAVWDQAFDGEVNIVEVYVSRLRRRLGEDVIRTLRGVGYRLGDTA